MISPPGPPPPPPHPTAVPLWQHLAQCIGRDEMRGRWHAYSRKRGYAYTYKIYLYIARRPYPRFALSCYACGTSISHPGPPTGSMETGQTVCFDRRELEWWLGQMQCDAMSHVHVYAFGLVNIGSEIQTNFENGTWAWPSVKTSPSHWRVLSQAQDISSCTLHVSTREGHFPYKLQWISRFIFIIR